MKRHARIALATLLALAGGLAGPAAPARAGRAAHAVAVGPRAVGLGGAASALAAGSWALFWNPAGLAGLDRQEVNGSRADLFGTGALENVGNFALPLGDGQAVGLEWYHAGYEDPGLDFGEDRFAFGYGRRLTRGVAVGATMKYLRRNVSADAVQVGEGHGFGADVGLLFTPRPGWRAALVLHDITDTRLNAGSDGTVYPRGLRVGAAWEPWPGGLLAAELDDQFHAGMEWTPLPALSVRAGVRQPLEVETGAIWSLGAGAQVGFLRVDVARELHPVLNATNHVGVGTSFHFNPSRVRIESFEVSDIYLSLYRSYADRPIGSARLRNMSTEPVEVIVELEIPGLGEEPTTHPFLLEPGAGREVPLSLLLPDRVTGLADDRVTQARLTVTYQSERLRRTERRQARLRAFGAGVLDWSARDGVAQAAAFVTPGDPVVADLAALVARHADRPEVREGFGTVRVALAAAAFDALTVLGLTYAPDPLSPYGARGGHTRAIDTVRYPRETLRQKSGDCDDTTVLVASLLSRLGIPTCFVDVPGHIFLLVDTGLHERHRAGLGLDVALTVAFEGRAWLPLETTALADGFAEAWRKGAEVWRGHANLGPPRLVRTEAAMARFGPGSLEGLPAARASLPDEGSLDERVLRDAATVVAWRDAWLKSHYAAAIPDSTRTPAALRILATIAHAAGRDSAAAACLDEWLRAEPKAAPALNNRAALAAAAGRWAGPEVEADLAAACAADPGEPLYAWNQALVRAARGDTEGRERAFRAALAAAGDPVALAERVGLPRSGASEVSLRQAISARIAPARRAAAGDASPLDLPWKE